MVEDENMSMKTVLSSHGIKMGQLETFTCFPKLITELRLEIWKLALCIPQVVAVKLKYFYYNGKVAQIHTGAFNRHSQLRRVCKEAREESIKVQVALNYVKMDHGIYHTPGGLPAYVNLATDILWFSNQSYLSDDFSALASQTMTGALRPGTQFKSIAISYNEYNKLAKSKSMARFMHLMKHCGTLGVSKLILVVGCSALEHCEHITLRGKHSMTLPNGYMLTLRCIRTTKKPP